MDADLIISIQKERLRKVTENGKKYFQIVIFT